MLELQVWHCLPAFCSWVTDLPSSYPALVKDIASAYQTREDLRPSIGQALERLYLQARSVLKTSGHREMLGPGGWVWWVMRCGGWVGG